MLTRRGFFKGLIGALGLLTVWQPRQVKADTIPASAHRYLRTRQDCLCGKQFCYEAARVQSSWSIYYGAAGGKLYLPPGRLYFRHSGAELERGRYVHPRAELTFEPSVCLTDAEHARLEADATPFNITVRKGCKT